MTKDPVPSLARVVDDRCVIHLVPDRDFAFQLAFKAGRPICRARVRLVGEVSDGEANCTACRRTLELFRRYES